MAFDPLGRSALAFNIPAGLAATYARDADFYRIYSIWRDLEDALNARLGWPDDDPEGMAYAERMCDAGDEMFARPVSTATALAMKLEALREADAAGTVDMEVTPGMTVLEAIERDCRFLAAREPA